MSDRESINLFVPSGATKVEVCRPGTLERLTLYAEGSGPVALEQPVEPIEGVVPGHLQKDGEVEIGFVSEGYNRRVRANLLTGRAVALCGTNNYEGVGALSGTQIDVTSVRAQANGSWTEPTIVGGYQSRAAGPTVRIRHELFESRVALRGALEATESHAANSLAFTLPLGYRPSSELLIPTGESPGNTAVLMFVKAGGQVLFGNSITNGNAFWLDGLSFPIT